jgi:glutaredoxin
MRTDRVGAPAGELVVYGADWCADCRHVKRFLDTRQVPYRWVDLERDREAQEWLDAAGYRAIPVVTTPGGAVLVEPSVPELARALGLVSRPGG